MFNKYYQDELAFLREMGQEFADAQPDAARFLGEAGSDPDVERLLEGFAFLTGRVRQKLDDELPELTHSMMELFFPQYLRVIPSMAVLQAQPREGIASEGVTLPRGSYLDAVKIDDVRCRFRTTSDLAPVPARVAHASFHEATPPALRVQIEALPGHTLTELSGQDLRLHLIGDQVLTRALYICLCYRLDRVSIGQVDAHGVRATPACLLQGDGMLPAPAGASAGFRLLQEYFAFPTRFMFVDVSGLNFGGAGAACEIEFQFSSAPDAMPPVSAKNLQLNCVPIVNLFEHDADPIRIEPERSEYKIRPGGSDLVHYEVYSVESVKGRVRGSADTRVFEPFFSFHRSQSSGGQFYAVRPVESMNYEGADQMVSIGGGDSVETEDVETLSLELVCTNRRVTDRLGLGDVQESASTTPMAFSYCNVTKPSPTIPAPSGDDVHWRLLSNLSLNYLSLLDVQTLRSLLRLYDFRAREDRTARRQLDNRMDAILEVAGRRDTLMLDGVPLRGVAVRLKVDEDRFGGEGEVYLFGTVFNEFLTQYVTLNSFSRLEIEIVNRGEVFEWSPRLGTETLA